MELRIITGILEVFGAAAKSFPTLNNDAANGKKKLPPHSDLGVEDLLRNVKSLKRREKIRSILQAVNADFTVDIYEIQIEAEPDREKYQRRLTTLCSSYSNPQSTSIWKKPGEYHAQTPYAFIKNRYMWITDENRGLLSKEINKNVKYTDAWSDTPSDEIPDFWTLGKTSRQVCTSVILPLRLPAETIACFGFIDFESVKFVQMNKMLANSFKEVAAIFALDYVERMVEKAKKNEREKKGKA
jgi:hypothetical protein